MSTPMVDTGVQLGTTSRAQGAVALEKPIDVMASRLDHSNGDLGGSIEALEQLLIRLTQEQTPPIQTDTLDSAGVLGRIENSLRMYQEMTARLHKVVEALEKLV